MARINIEDQWWSDPRRMKLAIKVGSGPTADGIAIAAWRLSQTYWANEKRSIPRPKFYELEHAQDLIEVGLAEDQGEFIYVKGSNEHHEWLIQRSAAGKSGNAKRWGKFDRKSSQTIASSSSSSSSSSSGSCSFKKTYAQQVERLYQELYPKKVGKTKGLQKLTKAIKTETDLADLERAMRKYASHVSGKDPDYIQHFSTFAGQWRDWLDPDAGRMQRAPRFQPQPVPAPPPEYAEAEDEPEGDPDRVRAIVAGLMKGME